MYNFFYSASTLRGINKMWKKRDNLHVIQFLCCKVYQFFKIIHILIILNTAIHVPFYHHANHFHGLHQNLQIKT